MNEAMKIVRINAYIQRKLGVVWLDGHTVMCVALDRTAAVEEHDAEIALSEAQIEVLYQQTLSTAPIAATERVIIDSCWWSPFGKQIGVVIVGHQQSWEAFIGIAHGNGVDRRTDELHIAEYGATLCREAALALFPVLDAMAYQKV